jgi:hypothetical protein
VIVARKKLVGQRVENQIRGLAVVFGVRLPRALTAAFIDKALKANEGIAGLSATMRGLIAARAAVMAAVSAIDADMRRMARASAACSRLMTIPGVGQPDRARLRGRNRRSFAHPPIPRYRRLSGLGSRAVSVRGGRLRRQHIEMRGQARADPPVRGRQRHADVL